MERAAQVDHEESALGYTWSYTAYAILPQINDGAMLHSNTPRVNKHAPLTTLSSSLKCISATEHHTAKRYFKTGRIKPWKQFPKSNLSLNIRLDSSRYETFEKLLWKPNKDAS